MPTALDDHRSVTVGLGVLSWRSPRTLDRTLASYARGNIFGLFDEALIFFQEIGDGDRAVAERYGLRCAGSGENCGIYGGVKALVEALETDYVLLLEEDCPLIEPGDQVRRQVGAAAGDLAAGRADVYRMRHRWRPGEKFEAVHKYRRYHPSGDGDGEGAGGVGHRTVVRLRRLLRPWKARRLAGIAAYVETRPELRHPRVFHPGSSGGCIVRSRHLNWTNQSILVSRQWMLQVILPYVAAHPSRRRVHGFPDIEKELNGTWWRRGDFRIGISNPGLFTHERRGG